MSIQQNAFRESYGLVVLVKGSPEKVMFVERNIPYCVHNLLLKKMNSFISDKTTSKNNDMDKINWTHSVRFIVKETLTTCKNDANLCNNIDFIRYKKGLIFEDQYDFPHGQMSAKSKRILFNYMNELYNIEKTDVNEENLVVKPFTSPTCLFLKKIAGFVTAFMEFEEETGFTFRFDFETILKLKTVQIQFTGLDGYDYLQNFYILEIDKVQKLIRKQSSNKFRVYQNQTLWVSMNSKNRKRLIFREIDKITYKPRLIEVNKAIDLIVNQQKELKKYDYKHILLNCLMGDSIINVHKNEIKAMSEKLFLNFVERLDPDIYSRCVKRIRWRDH